MSYSSLAEKKTVEQISIPKKGREFVNEHALRVQPLLIDECRESREFLANGGKLYHIESKCDYFSQSYPWNAKRIEEAKGLVEVGRITTYHSYGYYGFFKPSVAEVLQQIPEKLLNKTHYYVVLGPDDADALNEQKDAIDQGYHRATTILYRRKK